MTPAPLLRLSVALLVLACGEPPRDLAVIAHRGASWDAPEHTIAAWDLALAQGADWLEFDLQRTADSVLVVFHDDSLHRVARGPAKDCTGLVAERTLEQLRRCDVGRWFNERHPDRARAGYDTLRIATLDEILARYGDRARLYIELKDPDRAPGMERQLHEALQAHGLVGPGATPGRLLVQCFVPEGLVRFHALAPEVALVQLLGDSVPDARLDSALAQVARYARAIGPNHRLVTPRLVSAAHANGLAVHPYTVNDEARFEALLALGVDGVFTDRPGLLRTLLPPR
jgi:glycerophosphoryl diester phosphodiesterase